MVVNLEDLLRRRSKATLVIRKEYLDNADGLEAVSERLFGDKAQQKIAEFRNAVSLNRG
jgi:alpha-glycerophosphate oxidase/glycerol-3-phosphate dehydrogenase